MSDAGEEKPAKKAKTPKQPAGEKQGKAGKPEAAAGKDAKAAKKKGDGAKAAPTPAAEPVVDPNYVPRFKKHYHDVVRPELMEKFGYKNHLQAPRIEKIVLNIGAGEGAADQKKNSKRPERSDGDCRTESGDHAGKESDFCVQDHGRPAGRRKGHVAQGSDVRIP